MAVGVNIVANFDGKGISKAIKEFKKLDGGAAKSAFALGTLDKSATAAVKGLSKVAAGIGVAAGVIGYSLVKASIQAQAEQDRLRQILLTTNGATDAQVTALIAQAEALEKVGVASAGSIITAQSQLATFDLQYDTIKTLTPAITDYVIAEKGATATSEDFKSMTNGLAQALNGQFGALTKAGFVLDDQTKKLISNGTEAERAAAIVEVLSSTYGGFNEAIADTPEGQMVQLMNSFQALRTELGTLLLPAFLAIADFLQTKLIPYLDNLVDVIGDKGVGGAVQMLADDFLKMTGNMGKTGNIILGIVTAFVALKGAMMAYSIAQGIATIATTLFGVAWNATGIGLIAAAIAAIVIGLIALYIKFESVRKVVSALGDVLKFVVMNAIKAVMNFFIGFINAAIIGFNALIKVANFFGADLEEQELLGYKAFSGLSIGADNATKKVLNVAEALQKVKNEERKLEGKGTGTGTGPTIPRTWVVPPPKQSRR
jgi:multisubunit Na+/H+ antiporter MnhB subunit